MDRYESIHAALDEQTGVRFYPIETSSTRIRVIGNRTEPDWHLRLEANTNSLFIERRWHGPTTGTELSDLAPIEGV